MPVAETIRAVSGFMALERRYLDEMLAAIADRDAQGIAGVLGRQFSARRRVTNTEGHDMVLHTVRWQLDRELDLAAVRESFERHGLESHDDPPAWVLSRDTPSMPRATILNFSLDVEASVLTGEMNSVEPPRTRRWH